MARVKVTKAKLVGEDLELGTGTVDVPTSNGGTREGTKINASVIPLKEGGAAENFEAPDVDGALSEAMEAIWDLGEDTYSKAEVDTALGGKSDVGHGHAVADVSGLPGALDGKSPVGHNHDDRYFTEDEVTAALVEKSNVGHGHAVADVSGLQAALDGKAASSHTHTTAQVTGLDSALATKAPLASPALTDTPTAPTAAVGTNTTQIATTAFVKTAIDNHHAPASADHDDRYYTEAEVDAALSGKAPTAHDHASITGNAGSASKLQTARTISLTGNVSGSVSFDGSANATITTTVADDSHNHVIANVDGLQTALDGKSNTGHGHAIGDVSGLQSALDGKSSTSHNHDSTYAPLGHVGTGGGAHANAIASGAAGFMTGADKAKLDGIQAGAINQTAADTRYEQISRKGAANGYPSLGADGKIPSSQLPAIAIVDTFVVNTQAAMLALSAQKGDVAVRSDLNKTFILQAEPASTLANWQEMLTPTDAVLSVNGKTGAVTLTTSDVAEGSNQYFTDVRSRAAMTKARIEELLSGTISTHGHAIAGITGLQTALDGKSPVGHGHVIGDVTGLQSALDGKAAASHTHTIANVTGLQAALDGKAAKRKYIGDPLLALALGLTYQSMRTPVATVTVGTSPVGVCFDGTHVWVANQGSGNVSKINPSTNSVVATVTVGTNPSNGLVFDGTHIWVANQGSGNVSKINPSTNSVVATVTVGSTPRGVCFDGTHVWVTNYGSGNVSKINPSTNSVVATVTVEAVPRGVCFDGTHVWVTNYGSGNVSKIDPSTNSVVATVTVGSAPAGVCFDGMHVWVTNYGSGNVSKIDPSTDTVVATIAVGSQPAGVCFDGTHVWVTNYGSGNVSQINPSTDTVVATIAGGNNPNGVAFDGTYVWIANQTIGYVSKIYTGI
jgi:YVTN family beta-propeller protein